MSSVETLNHEPNQPHIESSALIGMGHVALAEGPGDGNEGVRDIQIGGESYQTTLPPDINPFEDIDGIPLRAQPLHPATLREIPLGSFEVEGVEKGLEGDYAVSRTLEVHASANGKMINPDAFSGSWELVDGAAELMKTLGYELDADDGYVTGVPMPETVVEAAHKAGVEVELVPDHKVIPGPIYLKAFSEGKYPISTLNESQYRHDIEDDHLTTLILGGDALRTALQVASKNALATGDKDTVDGAASAIDSYTGTLRAIIAWHPQLLGEAYGRESGRKTLNTFGLRLGITAEQTDAIIESAQGKARSFGLEVKELN